MYIISNRLYLGEGPGCAAGCDRSEETALGAGDGVAPVRAGANCCRCPCAGPFTEALGLGRTFCVGASCAIVTTVEDAVGVGDSCAVVTKIGQTGGIGAQVVCIGA